MYVKYIRTQVTISHNGRFVFLVMIFSRLFFLNRVRYRGLNIINTSAKCVAVRDFFNRFWETSISKTARPPYKPRKWSLESRHCPCRLRTTWVLPSPAAIRLFCRCATKTYNRYWRTVIGIRFGCMGKCNERRWQIGIPVINNNNNNNEVDR